jgi:hypothetical protein
VEAVSRAVRLLERLEGVKGVEPIGSRAGGDPVPLSDWDFRVHTVDFERVALRLPPLFAPLLPLASQWDRLSTHKTYMLVVEGPAKVDFLFDEPSTFEEPWEVSAQTLPGIDAHFWDWTLWLAAKVQRGKMALVASELEKMREHLLAPLGSERTPQGLGDAVGIYRARRSKAEESFGVQLSKDLETAVYGALEAHGMLGAQSD